MGREFRMELGTCLKLDFCGLKIYRRWLIWLEIRLCECSRWTPSNLIWFFLYHECSGIIQYYWHFVVEQIMFTRAYITPSRKVFLSRQIMMNFLKTREKAANKNKIRTKSESKTENPSKIRSRSSGPCILTKSHAKYKLIKPLWVCELVKVGTTIPTLIRQ